MVEWLIQIVLQLEVICQFSRHYKQCQCQIFMEYTCVYTHFSLTEWIVLNVMAYMMKMIGKLWRVWQFKRESTHQFCSTSHMQLVAVQTADNCTFFLHTCQSICNMLKSIRNSNLMWTRSLSEIWTFCFENTIHLRIELKQLRKTVIITLIYLFLLKNNLISN